MFKECLKPQVVHGQVEVKEEETGRLLSCCRLVVEVPIATSATGSCLTALPVSRCYIRPSASMLVDIKCSRVQDNVLDEEEGM